MQQQSSLRGRLGAWIESDRIQHIIVALIVIPLNRRAVRRGKVAALRPDLGQLRFESQQVRLVVGQTVLSHHPHLARCGKLGQLSLDLP